MLQTGGTPTATLRWPLTVAAWNLERCLFPAESAAHVAARDADVVLLSEMDDGMARTAQRDTTAEVAAALGMGYAYGVEFHELDLGGQTERHFCTDTQNARGWHGNAALAAAPFARTALVRLDDHGHWFVPEAGATDPGQPRVGGRLAVLGCWRSRAPRSASPPPTSRATRTPPHRAAQTTVLLDAIDAFTGDAATPVILGGDLNTGNHLPPDFDHRDETLFDLARTRGYHWDANPPGTTTRRSLITPHPTRAMKLDWFRLPRAGGGAGGDRDEPRRGRAAAVGP